MALIAAGVSHRTAPVEVREKLVRRPRDSAAAAAVLRAAAGVREVVTLSTCNRTEFYIMEGDADSLPALWQMLSEALGADASVYGYVKRDRDAAAHLFRVASGLDSMIVGEAQIQGQVRDAWESCRGQSGAVLNRLFQTALLVASRVRTETSVGRGAASVSSAAVQLSRKIFGSLTGHRAMILGAGEMAELALECLQREGVRAAIVGNRTFERAEELALRHGATAMRYDACWANLHDVDLLLCSTSSPHPIVTVDHVAPAVKRRGDRPLCILDIALPRDVDPRVGDLDDVFLYDLDDLRAVAASNIERRLGDLPAAESVVADEVGRFWEWLTGLAAVPALTQFRAEMERVRAEELQAAVRKMGAMSPEQARVLDQFSRSLMNKFLHEPTVRLRRAVATTGDTGVVDAVRYLFALGRDEPPRDAAWNRGIPLEQSRD